MTQQLNVLICPDHNYVMPGCVMLKSLFVNNIFDHINIYAIIDSDVTDADKNELATITKDYSASISFFYIDSKEIENYPGLGIIHLTKSAYFRLFAADILPYDIDRILYLDCDIIVRHSISDLWNVDINNRAIGCVIDMFSGLIDIYKRLKIPFNLEYTNSGVLLINLDFWRKNQVSSKFVQFIKNYPERISKLADQDVISYVLKDSKVLLPLKYNVQEGFYYKDKYATFDYWGHEKELKEAINDPVVLHFTGPMKPWIKGCEHPRKDEFFKYQQQTKWCNEKLKDRKVSFIIFIKMRLKQILIMFGMIKANKRFIVFDA